jgi:hypothetical protein
MQAHFQTSASRANMKRRTGNLLAYAQVRFCRGIGPNFCRISRKGELIEGRKPLHHVKPRNWLLDWLALPVGRIIFDVAFRQDFGCPSGKEVCQVCKRKGVADSPAPCLCKDKARA